MNNGCACCGDMLHRWGAARLSVGRRGFLALAGVAALPFGARAAEGQYDAMLLTCIDPRFPEHSLSYMRGRGLAGKYSQFAFAGAAIGAVAPAFEGWHKTFWENLAASIELHRIPKVIALDHRDCGAARIAFGADSMSTPAAETAMHKAALEQFRAEVKQRQPALAVETALMAIDGTVEIFS